MNTEDLIYITAHCPTEAQEKKLEECINSIEKVGYDIALVSHTHIPMHIQKKCKYYIYDYLNDISEDEDLLSYANFYFAKNKVVSKYFQKNFYGFAIFRMINLISNLSINFGYKKLHYIEYDCVVNDCSLIKENSELLESYDSILYTTTGDKNGGLIGAIHSCLTSKLPNLFKNYDKKNIEKLIKEHPNNCLENITKFSFMNSGNVLFKNANLLTNDIITIGYKFKDRNAHYCFYYDYETENINFIYHNHTDFQRTNNVMLIIDNNNIVNFETKSGFWYMRVIGNVNSVEKVMVFIDNELSHTKIFNKENVKNFKDNSYIIKN